MKGFGNQQDYGMRIYDPRVGRFLSVDPLNKEYPWYTPYQFAGNKPTRFIDLDGAEEMDPMTQFKYDGSWGIFEWAKAVPNATGRIWNTAVVDTWNSGVANARAASAGQWTQTVAKDAKAMGVGMKNAVVGAYQYHANTPAKQQLKDAGDYFTSPQALEDALFMGGSYYLGNKLPSIKGNLLKSVNIESVNIALGKNINLLSFSEKTASFSFHNFDKIPGYSIVKNSFNNFEDAFHYATQSAINTKGKLFFNLEYVNLQAVGKIKPGTGLYQGLKEYGGKSLWEMNLTTEWELSQILNNKELLNITEFKRMGQNIPASTVKKIAENK